MKLATSTLMVCVGAMLALSMVMLYSAAMHERGAHFLIMQLIWCAAGMVVCLAAAALDYRVLKKCSWLLFAITLLALIMVLHPKLGTMRGGARRWFAFSQVSIQPSELAKIVLIIALAHYGEFFQRRMGTFGRGLVLPGLLAGAIIGLIFFEPDRGTAILLSAVTAAILLVAGTRWYYLFPPILLIGALLAYLLVNDPVRGPRIKSWLDPEASRDGVGYQSWQAMLALGSGGVTGVGLGNGKQKLGFVPERHTDFILSVIGEELGLVATLSVVLLFILFVWTGLYIAWRARDVFGMLLASGITILIGLQALINIGVVTSTLPNKGLSLPFISYGGSNLIVMLGCVGVLLNIARQSQSSESHESVTEADFKEAQAF